VTSDKAAASRRWPVITALGLTQIMAWGSSYYLPAVLAQPIASDTGWPLGWVVGGLSLGLIAAGAVSPFVGRMIASRGGRSVLAVGACFLAAGLLLLSLAHSLAVFFARTALWGKWPVGDYGADFIRRLCQHGLLAALRIS